ncbi:uncharacterized protein LOC111901662 [Lactuca sativa]|uniref:uncharacterized protein LOC111901662 n=1 Tax=Lactuca sativa TaxID=4236 RepID=UPI000CD83700|nr:uncharacterized protein LOC111901662 [Lactuca sativa]
MVKQCCIRIQCHLLLVKVRIEEIVDQPSCSRRLFLEWKETEIGDCIGSSKPDVVPTNEFESDQIDAQYEPQGIFDEILNEEPGGITHESDNIDDADDSDDNKEWVGDLGGSNVKETETREIDDIEVVNNEVFLYESSSDEGGSNRRRKSIKAIRRALENSKARVSDPFYVYQKFTSSEELKDAIRKHVVETRELDFIKNNKNRVRAICKGTIPDLGQLDPCGPSQSDKESEENKCPWIESNPTVLTRALQEQLQREYQVDISKMKVFRAKKEALNQVRAITQGNILLRDYVQELHTRNPRTTVKIEVKSELNPTFETRNFKRIYICLGPLKKGFLAGKRDYLGLDGTFMKGTYPGMILTIVGLDGNNCTYPLAYAVVEVENINSWTYFLRFFGDDIDLQANSNFTLISDRQKGLLQAIGTLYPCVEHRFCLRHIHENMKKMWRGKVFQDMLWNCARRAHCDGLLNNLCETINNQIKKACDQSIITCLEFIREYLMLRIVSVQKVIDKVVGPLTPTATSVLEKNKSDVAQCVGKFCGNGNYQVSGPWMDQCVVDMVQHTCSCRRWELTGVPCKHTLVAIWDMRKNKQNVSVPEEWVRSTYWLKTWKEMYSFKIEPINVRRMWENPCPTTLLPPNHHVLIRRLRKKKRKSTVELEDIVKGGRASRKDNSVTCSKCKKLGHKKRSCKGQSDGSSINKGKDGKKDQSSSGGSSSKKENFGKEAQSIGGGRQSGTQSACDGISSRTRKAGNKGKSIA